MPSSPDVSSLSSSDRRDGVPGRLGIRRRVAFPFRCLLGPSRCSGGWCTELLGRRWGASSSAGGLTAPPLPPWLLLPHRGPQRPPRQPGPQPGLVPAGGRGRTGHRTPLVLPGSTAGRPAHSEPSHGEAPPSAKLPGAHLSAVSMATAGFPDLRGKSFHFRLHRLTPFRPPS